MWECYHLIPHRWLEVFYPCSGPHLDYVNETKLLVFVSALGCSDHQFKSTLQFTEVNTARQAYSVRSEYLCDQDVITWDVIHIFISLSIQLSGQLNKDPPPVCDPFSLKELKMQKKWIWNEMNSNEGEIPCRTSGWCYLSMVEFLIWVRQTWVFSRTAIQVDVARPKSWEKTNFWCSCPHCNTQKKKIHQEDLQVRLDT